MGFPKIPLHFKSDLITLQDIHLEIIFSIYHDMFQRLKKVSMYSNVKLMVNFYFETAFYQKLQRICLLYEFITEVIKVDHMKVCHCLTGKYRHLRSADYSCFKNNV